MIVSKVQPPKVYKAEEAVVGVDRTIEEAATEVKTNHKTCVMVTLDAIPRATIASIYIELP